MLSIGTIIIILISIISIIIIKNIIILISDLIDAIYTRTIVEDSIDKVIRTYKYQQLILQEVGIECKVNISRANFADEVKKLYYEVDNLFINNYDKFSTRLSDAYKIEQKRRFGDNLNAINLALMDYDVANIRYSYDVDKLGIFGNGFTRYKFIEDVNYKNDNGLENTSALYGGLYEF